MLIRSLAQFLRNRMVGVLAAWGLIFAQAQLVWVLELHWHAVDGILMSRCLLRDADSSSKGAAVRPLCTLCQVARETTARPATGFAVAVPDVVMHFRPTISPPDFNPGPSTIVRTRAPPVS